MKVLVATVAYPTLDGKRPMYFVHSRNMYYQKSDIAVTVLNFGAKQNYEYDGIKVITFEYFKNHYENYNMLICHAPNLRNHYRFLKKYGNQFPKKVFIFHGHEVLHINKYYPLPYDFKRRSRIKYHIQNWYDTFKLVVWKRYFLANIDTIRLMFVSKFLLNQFLKELRVERKRLLGHVTVISNSIGNYFEEHKYSPQEIKYDFITIRSDWDNSNYSIDIVTKIASMHPNYQFCIVGNGEYFDYNELPDNIVLLKGNYTHAQLAEFINSSHYALMPTRHDSQGLMSCELAAFGIPLITSDIEVCREIFSDCPNCVLISNDTPDLEIALSQLDRNDNKVWDRYYAVNTIFKEIAYIKEYREE